MSKGVILTTHSVYSSFDSEIKDKTIGVEVEDQLQKESPKQDEGSRLRASRMSKE